MEKILKNEQTNEQTNKRASKRIEQKFKNKISSKIREIEENLFFRRCSGDFYKILGIAINYYFMCKKQEI